MKKLTYRKVEDYLIPNIKVNPQKIRNYGKYSEMRLEYLKKNKNNLYQRLLIQQELENHLEQIQMESEKKILELMNNKNIKRNIAEKIIIRDLIRI